MRNIALAKAHAFGKVLKVIAGLVAATSIPTGGSLTLGVFAHAYPPKGSECTQFGFHGPQPFEANGHPPRDLGDGPWRLRFPSVGTTASGPATVFFFNTAETITGHVVGGRIERRNIAFRVQFDDKPDNFWNFTGAIDDHGTARGTEALDGGGSPATWTSGFALDCLAPAPLLYGPDTCEQQYVWREAVPSDHVCVTWPVRDETATQNSLAAQNRQPGGGAYGPDTCKQTFVWRDAVPGDHVCVLSQVRDDVAAQNAASASHLAVH